MIKRIGKNWVLYSQDGSKVLGKHATKAEALAQERVINMKKKRTR